MKQFLFNETIKQYKKITNLKKELRFTSLTIGAFFITSIAMLMLAFTPKASQLFVNTNSVKTNDVISIHVAFSNVESFAANSFSKSANNFPFIKPTYSVVLNNIHSTYTITKVNFISVLGKNTSNTFTI